MSLILILIFAFLGGIHTYWALGGTWGTDIVLPTNPNGQTMLQPSPLMTIVVSGGLFIFAAYYMLSAGWVNFHLPRWLQLLAGWGIPSIFLLRAIGDFNYVGLFRKVTDTPFGKNDRLIFTPVCILISTLGFWLEFGI